MRSRARWISPIRQGGHEPERADEERALLAGEPVVGLVGAVAQDEAVLGQLVGDREHAGAEPLVVAGEEAEDRGQQRRRIERVGRVVLAQGPASVDAVLEDVGADLLGLGGPAARELVVAAQRAELRRAVERHPAHEPR
jgi:hypothetical protein